MNPRQAPCPACGAQPGEKCLYGDRRRSRPHGARLVHESHRDETAAIAKTLADAQAAIVQAHDRTDQGHGAPYVVVRVDDLQDLLDHVEDLHARFLSLDKLLVPRFLDRAEANRLLNKIAPFIRTAPIPGRIQP